MRLIFYVQHCHKVLFIIGSTGVGKTKLSVELAKAFGGEIINADAMQVSTAR